MIRTFGEISDTAPEGFLPRRVHFPTMVRLDEPTIEGPLARTIQSAGFSTRDLPRPIDGMGPGRGHEDTVPVGRVDKLTIDGSNVEGWAWIANTEAGRAAYQELELQISTGTSIVMADVEFDLDVQFPEDSFLPKISQVFTKANLDRTTLVMGPAFGTASVGLEELTASFAVEGDLEVAAPWTVADIQPELTAAMAPAHIHADFDVPEPDAHQTWALSRDCRTVTGHLGTWDSCHTGFFDRCVRIPRSRSNYASYCKHAQPTEKGTVYTGPVVLLRGHKATRELINEAMQDVANIVADVVVVDGKFGPWMCGVVRPGVTEEALAAMRGSDISGHWLKGELYAVAAVCAAGFDVPRATRYAVVVDENNEVEDLVATFSVGCDCDEDETGTVTEDELSALIEQARALLEDDDAGAKEVAAA